MIILAIFTIFIFVLAVRRSHLAEQRVKQIIMTASPVELVRASSVHAQFWEQSRSEEYEALRRIKSTPLFILCRAIYWLTAVDMNEARIEKILFLLEQAEAVRYSVKDNAYFVKA